MPRCQARLRPSTHLERRYRRMTSGRVMREPLRTLLGDYPTTRAVRQGTLISPRVPLAFADVPVPNKAFKRVVRDLEFDVAELALMTFLMARSRGVPLRLLPVVVFSRNPLPHLVCDTERGRLQPRDLAGRRIAVRAYTTTTAVWVRALLADAFGVDLASTRMARARGGTRCWRRRPADSPSRSCRCGCHQHAARRDRRCRHRRSRSGGSAIRFRCFRSGGRVP